MMCDKDEAEMRGEWANAREQLLGEWSSIQKLPFKELGQLCRKKAEGHKKVWKVAPSGSLFWYSWGGCGHGGTRSPWLARDDCGVPMTRDPPASMVELWSQWLVGRSITCYVCGGGHYAKECPKNWDCLAM